MSPEPYPRILFDHIAIGVPDAASVKGSLVDALGGSPYSAGAGHGFRFWQWQFDRGGRIEILRPDGPPDGFLHRFLERRGPGIHHITFKVPDLAASVARAAALGFDVVGHDESDPTWKEAFIHPRQAAGIVVQMAEEHDDPDAADVRSLATRPESARDPVRLLGLRMVAADAASAQRLYGELLCGNATRNGEELVFDWPGSPMRIAVSLDATATPGPVCIEFSADHPVELGDAPDPVLGARFRRLPPPPA